MGSGQIPLKSQLFYIIEAGESLGIRLRLLLILLLLLIVFFPEEATEEAALFRLGLFLFGVLGALDVGNSGLLRLARRQNGRADCVAAGTAAAVPRDPKSFWKKLRWSSLGWEQVFRGAVPSRKGR